MTELLMGGDNQTIGSGTRCDLVTAMLVIALVVVIVKMWKRAH